MFSIAVLTGCAPSESDLFRAVENNDVTAVKNILQKDETLAVEARDEKGRSPLEAAADREAFEIAEILRNHGASAEFDKIEYYEALRYGDFKKVKRFVALGADVNKKDDGGFRPLNRAAAEGDNEIAVFLIEQGADVNAKDAFGLTPLHRAAANGLPGTCKILLEQGADINKKDDQNWTPLRIAEEMYHMETAEFLKSRGAE